MMIKVQTAMHSRWANTVNSKWLSPDRVYQTDKVTIFFSYFEVSLNFKVFAKGYSPLDSCSV